MFSYTCLIRAYKKQNGFTRAFFDRLGRLPKYSLLYML